MKNKDNVAMKDKADAKVTRASVFALHRVFLHQILIISHLLTS